MIEFIVGASLIYLTAMICVCIAFTIAYWMGLLNGKLERDRDLIVATLIAVVTPAIFFIIISVAAGQKFLRTT